MTSTATGVARFVRFNGSAPASYKLPERSAAAAEDRSLAFLTDHGAAFGLRNARSELRLVSSEKDAQGGWHVNYEQLYRDVPVFAARFKTHFAPDGQLSAVNGVIVPDLTLEVTPAISQAEAERTALRTSSGSGLAAEETRLVLYRFNLSRNIPGQNHLAYVMEVTNHGNVRDFVAIDAHTGKTIERFTMLDEALSRKIYETQYDPANLVWQEGDIFPGSLNADQQNLVHGSGESYDLFMNMAGRDSFDGAGALMEVVNNDPRISCPNANWNGVTTNYCNGVTSDDIVAHEWGHAYTEYTHDLIYQWQPGALNESYSDIWGTVVDLLNNRGTDSPYSTRASDSCTLYTPAKATVEILSPESIAGTCLGQAAAFGPTSYDLTAEVVLANDNADGTTHLACGAINNASAITGKIALIDRGSCTFTTKVKNAQNAGAIGVLVANNDVTGLPGMGGTDATVTIPSIGILRSVGTMLKENPGATAQMLNTGVPSGDDSYRWLMGEDSTAFGGAIRDMWTPNCYSDPGKVSDGFYHCGTTDNGGVHVNSGIPNHAFALLVDGGSYNQQTISAIGVTRASHIYWRAQALYQTPSSDFTDHANALEQSCSDLLAAGTNLNDLSTGEPSGQSISAEDCQELSKAILATELRLPPAQCNFQPLLKPDAPAFCAPNEQSRSMFNETFETGSSGWTVAHEDVFSPVNLDWERTNSLPGGRAGSAMYAFGGSLGNCSSGAGDASRVMYLTSPEISITADNPRLAFEHYMASESLWDGGNLQVSVDGGGWVNISARDFAFNAYNALLNTSGQGNTNPLAGQAAFTGSDGGSLHGSWGQSQVDLSAYAGAGQTIQLRFSFGADGCSGIDGWYVDNVQVYTCLPVFRAYHPLVMR